ncbi:MAG: hypothetical protein ABIP48_07455, partial [Planctomycetota bacterium]
MSRVNVDHLSGLFSIELVTPAIGPPGAFFSKAGRSVSFERYLEQAARTFQTTADTHRPTTPDTSRRDADDRSRHASGPPVAASSDAPSRRADPGSRVNEPAAASRTPSVAVPQKSVSQADQEPAASDAD